MPLVRRSRTTPPKPSSPITTLLPPARTRTGRPSAAALRTVATASSRSAATVNVPGGPPRRSVVYAASELSPAGGVSMWWSALTSGTSFTLGSTVQSTSIGGRSSGEYRDEQAARDEGLLVGGTTRRQPRTAGRRVPGRAGHGRALLPRVAGCGSRRAPHRLVALGPGDGAARRHHAAHGSPGRAVHG